MSRPRRADRTFTVVAAMLIADAATFGIALLLSWLAR